MRCRACGRSFSLAEYADELDEAIERRLAGVRCDRL
nr:dual CXXC motif small (seleno)protein [Dissulfurirhabdus thermomarina]